MSDDNNARLMAAPSSNPLRGIIYIIAATSVFPLLNASVKYLGDYYPMPQLVWFRYAGHFLFMLIIFMPTQGLTLFRTTQLSAQIGRSVLLLASTTLYFVALTFIPLATAASISFTNPFILTALSAPLLGEVIRARRWSAVVIGFIGALIIIRPGLDGFHWAGILVVGSSGCYSLYQIMTRRIAGTDSAATTTIHTAIFGTLVCTLVVPFYWQAPQSLFHWALLVGLGVSGGLGHYFVVKAFQWAEASTVAPFGYMQLVGALILGYLVFGELPDGWTWFGAAIIVSAGLYIAYREGVRKAR
jgi:drug/metabolite transporter (DMT)-like permease